MNLPKRQFLSNYTYLLFYYDLKWALKDFGVLLKYRKPKKYNQNDRNIANEVKRAAVLMLKRSLPSLLTQIWDIRNIWNPTITKVQFSISMLFSLIDYLLQGFWHFAEKENRKYDKTTDRVCVWFSLSPQLQAVWLISLVLMKTSTEGNSKEEDYKIMSSQK